MIRLAAVSLALILSATAVHADPGEGRRGDRGQEARGEGRHEGGRRNGDSAPTVQQQRMDWQARRGGQQQEFRQRDGDQTSGGSAPSVQTQRSDWQARQQQNVRQRDNVQPPAGAATDTRSADRQGDGQRWRGRDNRGDGARDFGNSNGEGARAWRRDGGDNDRPPAVANNGRTGARQWNGDGGRRGDDGSPGAGSSHRNGGDYNLRGGNDDRGRNFGNNGQDWRGGDNRRGDSNRWTERGRDNANFDRGGDRRYDSYNGRHGRPGEGRALRDRDHGRSWYNPQYFQQQYRAVHRYRAAPYRYPSGWFVRTWYYGDYLPGGWYASHYYLDWRAYGLGYPPIGCEWVRVGRDALLVDVWSGEVLSVYYDLFW